MADMFTVMERSKIMAAVKSKNTAPELMLKKAIKGMDFNYQPKMFGNPDLANKTKKVVVFVDGCFWHNFLGFNLLCIRHYSSSLLA